MSASTPSALVSNSGVELTNPELILLRFNKEGGYNYRFRKEQDWRENYTLYRDRFIYNRLTQRQTVNIPLMKTQLRTILKDIDDMPVLQFENLDNDKQAELFLNEYWKHTIEYNRMELKDIVDKKQDLHFGRTFDQMQIIDGKVAINIVDPEDILVDRYVDPTNLDSARWLIHTHIFVPLKDLELNPDYDKQAIENLKVFYATNMGLIKAKQNQDMLAQKNRKYADLGIYDIDSPILGETYVELSTHLIKRREGDDQENQIYMYVECDNMEILMKKPLEQVIGVTEDHYWRTHFNYNSWADDVDMQDFWTDGVADIVRTPNKILNTWFSQMVENRTLKNFNMNVYDATIEGFAPSTFEPKAWGWYPVPGKPGEAWAAMPIGDLTESLQEMEYVQQIVDKATGATETQQGATQSNIQLGQVQLALMEARERVKGMSKFYTKVWEDRGTKFLKLIEAAPDKLDAVRIYKKGLNTSSIFSKVIDSSDWQSKAGYHVRVWSQDDKATQDTQKLQKLSAAVGNMPGNQKLAEIYDRKLLEFADLEPDQINEVMQAQEQLVQAQQMAMMQQQQMAMGGQPGQPGLPPGQNPPAQNGSQPALPQQPLALPAGGGQ